MSLNFPDVNYGSIIRDFESGNTSTYAPTISIPRPKYTWFVYLETQPDAIKGNLDDGQRNGKILAALKSVDHPQVSYELEKLRSYNNVRNVPIRMEYKPFALTFFDDTTSYVAGLLKSYRRFYHHSADAVSAEDFGDQVGNSDRSSSLPSMGMKMRSTGRHFFTKITLIDLGTAPNSVNIYHYVNPSISDHAHQSLDYDDLAGKVEVVLNFQYEGYYEEIGKTAADYSFIFDQLAGGSTLANVNDDRVGQFLGFDDGGFVGGLASQVIGNVANGLPGILSATFANGEFNSKELKTQLFQSASRGTPIQDVRNVIRTATQGKAAIKMGNPVGLLGAARQLGSSVGNIGKIVPNSVGVANVPFATSDESSLSSSDLMRRATDWLGSL